MTFQADSVEITVLVENWVDMLLPDLALGDTDHCVRTGLIEHFDVGKLPHQAENGISLLVRARKGRHTSTVLFDAGLTGTVLLHNLAALGWMPPASTTSSSAMAIRTITGGCWFFSKASSAPLLSPPTKTLSCLVTPSLRRTGVDVLQPALHP